MSEKDILSCFPISSSSAPRLLSLLYSAQEPLFRNREDRHAIIERVLKIATGFDEISRRTETGSPPPKYD